MKTCYESMRDAIQECGIETNGFEMLAKNETMWEVLIRRTVAQRAVVAEKFACGTRGRDALTTNELLSREYHAGVFGPLQKQGKKKKTSQRAGRVDLRTVSAPSPSPPRIISTSSSPPMEIPKGNQKLDPSACRISYYETGCYVSVMDSIAAPDLDKSTQ